MWIKSRTWSPCVVPWLHRREGRCVFVCHIKLSSEQKLPSQEKKNTSQCLFFSSSTVAALKMCTCVKKCQRSTASSMFQSGPSVEIHLPWADIMRPVLLHPAPRSICPPLHVSHARWENSNLDCSTFGIYQTKACYCAHGEMPKVHWLCHRPFCDSLRTNFSIISSPNFSDSVKVADEISDSLY